VDDGIAVLQNLFDFAFSNTHFGLCWLVQTNGRIPK